MGIAGRQPIFRGAQATGTTIYYPVQIHRGVLGVQFAWIDATSNATVTVELTSFDADEAPYDVAGSAWKWKDSGQTITGPAASAAGSTLIQFENVRALRGRLKVVTTANSNFVIFDGVATP